VGDPDVGIEGVACLGDEFCTVQSSNDPNMPIGTYVELAHLNTWYAEYGAGEPLVLLHPGGVDSRAFEPNLEALAARFRVFTPDRRGHGRTPDVDGPITFELMAEDTIKFLERVAGEPAHLFGMSDGATVGLLAALRRPDLIRRLVVVAGVFHRDGWVPGVLDDEADAPEFFAENYGEVSPDGRAHHPVVAAKLARMHAHEPFLSPEDLKGVTSRTLVMIGDDDQVQLEHAIGMYRAIRDCELAVVPGTSHGLLVEKPGLCNSIIIEFLATGAASTLAPIRRR
jgi:pimeloyl-ACP methyl ester carboxylesterase